VRSAHLPRGANTKPIRRVRRADGWLWKAASDQNDDRPITESEERQEISGWREKGWQAPAEIC